MPFLRTAAARRTGLALSAAAALALSGLTLAPTAGAQPAAQPPTTPHSRTAAQPLPDTQSLPAARRITTARSCAVGTRPGMMACQAVKVTAGANTLARSTGSVGAATAAPAGYGPADLLSAYALPADGGSGATVAVVDAYDNPDAEADLATYRSTFGLPACGSADGCFRKVGQDGSATALPAPDRAWSEEISLDLDMVSAICPRCRILLVEASTSAIDDLGTAVNTAVSLGAGYVSNSYGGGESAADSSFDSRFFDHPGVAITASAGDAGYGAEYPAASQYVTAIGGTTLTRDASARGWGETAWAGSGSGCTSWDPKPAWQQDAGCAGRTISDVSAVADPSTGVAVYDTYGGDTGWEVFGGTSVAAPLIASVYALAGTPPTGSYPASFPYAHPAALNDAAGGSNGSCAGSYLCTGLPGYDGPTGLGTPAGTAAFQG
ncbi:physarolisin II. Serine peptidase. MEROPS family S53 [Streptomyces sp. DvalAA-14]|uniref:S53 family peptidase n=1 Tax=unclassified Streptomyces TaxID=2593676 RepID=UPI00081B85FD|nr:MULTISPECIES: peptidase S8 [unclassified Streptomyces]MYS24456.1 peptidase S8 [Streptomyces sp. SID4948]SCE46249.1 physarolisin II. Serine peptidase. MEROPS family S53 [Streptomyces sp. DvalAA-14]